MAKFDRTIINSWIVFADEQHNEISTKPSWAAYSHIDNDGVNYRMTGVFLADCPEYTQKAIMHGNEELQFGYTVVGYGGKAVPLIVGKALSAAEIKILASTKTDVTVNTIAWVKNFVCNPVECKAEIAFKKVGRGLIVSKITTDIPIIIADDWIDRCGYAMAGHLKYI